MMGFLVLILGLAVGSFIDCVVYRINEDKKGWKKIFIGRSYCPKCRHQLAWYDNLPLLSFIFLRGKCRWCRSPIGWHYPLAELATAILTLLVFYLFRIQMQIYDLRFLIYKLIIIWVLIAIFLSDLRYRTIPDQIVYPAIFLTLGYHFFTFSKYHTTVYGNYLLAGLGAAGFFLLLVFLTKAKGMGLGDVKLAGLMGLFLGFPKIVVALCLAFLTGALVGGILVLTKKKTFKSQIPFGPFLVGATFISLFWGEKIWQIFL